MDEENYTLWAAFLVLRDQFRLVPGMGASIKYPVPDYSMIPLVMQWFNLDMAIDRKRLMNAWNKYIKVVWEPQKGR